MKDEFRKTILLVEDEAIIAIAEARSIRSFGYEVITTYTGEEAVNRAIEDETIDLVLMDIDLGEGITGPEAAEQILNKRNLPIVFLTSHAEKEYVDKVKKITRYGYVLKNSGDFVLQSSIEMAFELFSSYTMTEESENKFRSSVENGSVGGTTGTSDCRLVEAALVESKQKFDELVARIPVGVYRFHVDASGKWINDYVSPRYGEIFNLSVEDLLNNVFSAIDYAHPEDREDLIQTITDAVAEEKHFMHLGRYLIRGETRWIHAESYPTKLNTGLVNWDGIIQDVTERAEAEERIKRLLLEKELLLREVHHRVKNNLATIISLLSLQSNQVKNPETTEAFRSVEGRIRSMLLVYNKLNHSGNFKTISVQEYLTVLIDEIIRDFPNSEDVKIEKHIEDFNLEVKTISILGIIVNELLTNTMKHAFTGIAHGIIRVSASAAGNHAVISVEDNGRGLPESIDIKSSTGFGLNLVEALSGQLGGSFRIERSKGTKFTITFDI
ncbi:MAG: response regulator [bacterium]|nr:response regulator [bacterium]